MIKTKVALIRQEQTGCDGGAQTIVDLMLETFGSDPNIDVSLLCRRWDPATTGISKIIIDPAYRGRTAKIASFLRAVKHYLQSHPFDLIQSHERLDACDLFRAGDGVHKVWLQQKAKVVGPLGKIWLTLSPFHRLLLREEKKMFESQRLKAVICNSEMVAAEIKSLFNIAPEKLRVIHNGVDIQRFHPQFKSGSSQIRDEIGVPQDCLLFVFPGSGFERKNLITLLRAMACLPDDNHLVIAGNDKRRKYYERFARQSNMAHRVHFLGVIEKARMPLIYATCDVLVLPTLYDPFPNAILEGMAAGLPCITSEACGAAAVIRDHHAGTVVDPLDANQLAQAMMDYGCGTARSRAGAAARAAAEKFTVQQMRENLIGLYNELLENDGSR